MKYNLPAIFESAIAEVITQWAQIQDFPRIRTWRSVDAEGRWSPENDRVLPAIYVTASGPEPDNQDERQVNVTVGAMTNTNDDLDHAYIAEIEAELQYCLDTLEAEYCKGGPMYQTFIDRVYTETAGAQFEITVGGFTQGGGVEPSADDGMNSVEMSIVVHYTRRPR